MVEPVDETERLVAEIADAVGAAKRRRVEQNAASSAKPGVGAGNPIAVVGG